jgi:hypothetical protein
LGLIYAVYDRHQGPDRGDRLIWGQRPHSKAGGVVIDSDASRLWAVFDDERNLCILGPLCHKICTRAHIVAPVYAQYFQPFGNKTLRSLIPST